MRSASDFLDELKGAHNQLKDANTHLHDRRSESEGGAK